MAVLDIRQRTGWLFLFVTFGHIILISAQVNTQRGVPLLEEVTFGVFAEVQRVATSAIGGARDMWENYFALQTIREENERLRREVTDLRVGLQQERAAAQQARSLQALLELREAAGVPTTGAGIVRSAVIGSGASPQFRTITIDKGTQDGLRADMAVLAAGGVVGRIVMAGRRASKVQLLIDQAASAAAVVERSRAQGLVVGTDDPARLRMRYVSGAADVKPGDTVVTSGLEGIYPKGFAIGRIESVQRGSGALDITLGPAVAFSDLEAVLVVLAVPPVEDPSEDDASGIPAAGTAQ